MENNRRRAILGAMVLALLLAGLGLEGGRRAAGQPPPAFAGEGPWVVRAYYQDRAMVAAVAAWAAPWEVRHDEGFLVVEADRAGVQRLLDLGFRVEVDQALTEQYNRPNVALPGQRAGIPGYPCYRTVEETYATAQGIVAAHPTLASWLDVGDTWEKAQPGGNNGYDLLVLRLTNSATAGAAGPKPRLFVMSSIHAREYAPAEIVTRFAEYLADNYGLDADATWLLDQHEIHLLLQANPDGRKKAETGLSWRKNTDSDDGCAASSLWGVDLNRNFEFAWGCCGGSSGTACAVDYRGPGAASEPETQTVQNYVRSQFPDQRDAAQAAAAPADATGVFLDVHSYSELVLWPWGFTNSPAPNGAALQTLGRKFAFFNGYWPDQAIGLYPTDGTTDDFAYGDLGVAAYTFEVGTSFFQDCTTFQSDILPGNLQALIYAAKVARTPYQTPAGPDALAIGVTPAAVGPGGPVQVTATLDDTRYNNSNGSEAVQAIAAAEVYVDVPPWSTAPTPVALPLAAVDGVFDANVETAQASLDTAGLGVGRHILYVRGRDTAGNWGAFSAVFLDIVPDPQVWIYLPSVLRQD